jgi:hypothetical protein
MTSRAWFCRVLPRGKTLPRRPASAGGNVHDSPASMQKMHPKMQTWDSPASALLFPGRGLHSSSFQLNLSLFGHTSPCPPV